jgi:hypothetical protein
MLGILWALRQAGASGGTKRKCGEGSKFKNGLCDDFAIKEYANEKNKNKTKQNKKTLNKKPK